MNDRSDIAAPKTAGRSGESERTAAALWSDASLFGVALIWGINIPIMKTGIDQLDPFVFNAIRLTISAGVLAAVALRERRRSTLPLRASGLRGQVLIYAMVTSALYQLLFLLGIARTTSGNTALIIATVPMWTALLARLFLGETLRRLAWGGLLIALVGTIVVALQKGDVGIGGQHLLGNLLILLSALTWAGGTVYSRPLLRVISPVQLAAWGAMIALPVHLLCAAGTFGGSWPSLQSVNVWLIILYAGILSSGLALPMWNFGVRHAGAAHAAVIQNLIPLIAIVAAWIARGESATLAQILGGALIVTGLVTMRLARPAPISGNPR